MQRAPTATAVQVADGTGPWLKDIGDFVSRMEIIHGDKPGERSIMGHGSGTCRALIRNTFLVHTAQRLTGWMSV